MQMLRTIFTVLGLVAITGAAIPSTFVFAADKPVKTATSLSAKLYWAARLMDNHENWPRISELLRQALEMDIDNDMIRSRLKTVKKYVDQEWARQKAGKIARTRLDTDTFLEARILLTECIQEARPRLNLSWTREVRLFKKMLFTALFPHAEGYGKIEFPDPKTYAFDLYGYTMKNIRQLTIGKGGKKLVPLFEQYLRDKEEKKKTSFDDWDDDSVGADTSIRSLTALKDKIGGTLVSAGIDPDSSSDILPEGWDPDSTDWGSGDWGNDDWDWRRKSEAEERILTFKKAYTYLKAVLTTLRNNRTIDEFEPLTLMMVAIANPGLIEHDPQLKDFVAGIKFKLQIPISGMDSDTFKPKDYDLIRLVNEALTPQNTVKLKLEVDSRTGQQLLYLISNFNGHSNIVSNIVSFRNIAMFVQGAKYMPEGVITFAKITPDKIGAAAEGINKMITNWSESRGFLLNFVGSGAKIGIDLVVTIGGKPVTKLAEATTKTLQKIAASPKFQKGVDIVKSERFLRTVVALSAASDFVAGIIEYNNVTNKDQRPYVVMHRGANIASALVYLTKVKPVIWTAVALDLGHLLYDDIWSVSQVFEYGANYAYADIYTRIKGYSPLQKQMNELKGQLGIKETGEAELMLREYEQGIDKATTVAQMDEARNRLATRLGEYAARRLVFQYVMITALNGKGHHDLGIELKKMYEEYDLIYWQYFTAPGHGPRTQAGLRILDHEFDEKYKKLGGKLPEPPKADPAKPGASSSDDKKDSKKDSKKPSKDFPWED